MVSAILRKAYVKSSEQKLRCKCTAGPLSVRANGVTFVVLCLCGLLQAQPLTLCRQINARVGYGVTGL